MKACKSCVSIIMLKQTLFSATATAFAVVIAFATTAFANDVVLVTGARSGIGMGEYRTIPKSRAPGHSKTWRMITEE